MKQKVFILGIFMLSIFSTNCFANDATENLSSHGVSEEIYLTQILNQIDAMKPLIIAAEKAQPANTRIKFHYSRYRDSHGNLHNGLLEDVQAIKSGISQKLNDTRVEPRVVTPIKGDYIGQ